MASNTFRSDPKRAAELAAILARHCAENGDDIQPIMLASVVADMQAAARSAKRIAEHACNYGYRDDAHEARTMKRQDRAQDKINAALANVACVMPADKRPTIELGGDPRGPCARLHIPGQRGDGWGDGFAVY